MSSTMVSKRESATRFRSGSSGSSIDGSELFDIGKVRGAGGVEVRHRT